VSGLSYIIVIACIYSYILNVINTENCSLLLNIFYTNRWVHLGMGSLNLNLWSVSSVF